jgi:16S rRNA (cytosine1402-N4)-methyltransferase
MAHQSVLLKEIVSGLDIKDNDIVLDCTLGNGGHSLVIYQSAKNVKIIGIDADETAIINAQKRFQENKAEIVTFNSYFDQLDKAVSVYGYTQIDKVLFDLGLRTDQIEEKERGFSFNQDGPLKMTFSKNPNKNQVTAYDVVNDWGEETLADIIYGFGEETFSRRISRAIVEARKSKAIETTFELRDIIVKSLPKFLSFKKIHPATKTFQAIRIAVNNELERIKIATQKAFEILKPQGRIAVISFHSLEDRIIKNFFKEKVLSGEANFINKKPIVPSDDEIRDNPKSRSAKLRIIQKI